MDLGEIKYQLFCAISFLMENAKISILLNKSNLLTIMELIENCEINNLEICEDFYDNESLEKLGNLIRNCETIEKFIMRIFSIFILKY